MSQASYTVRVPDPSTDAPGMSRVMAPSRWPDTHWRALFDVGTTLEQVVTDTAARIPFNLITARAERRHQVAVDIQSGEVLAYVRWVLPDRFVVEEGAKGEVIWREAKVPKPTSEDQKRFQEDYKLGIDETGQPKRLRHELNKKVRSPPLYAWDEKVLAEHGEVLTLDYLSTSPDYQRKGIGAALLEVGLDLADKLGLKTYVTASPIGLKLYLDHGFVIVKKLEVDYSMYIEGTEPAVDYYMIRQPKAKQV